MVIELGPSQGGSDPHELCSQQLASERGIVVEAEKDITPESSQDGPGVHHSAKHETQPTVDLGVEALGNPSSSSSTIIKLRLKSPGSSSLASSSVATTPLNTLATLPSEPDQDCGGLSAISCEQDEEPDGFDFTYGSQEDDLPDKPLPGLFSNLALNNGSSDQLIDIPPSTELAINGWFAAEVDSPASACCESSAPASPSLPRSRSPSLRLERTLPQTGTSDPFTPTTDHTQYKDDLQAERSVTDARQNPDAETMSSSPSVESESGHGDDDQLNPTQMGKLKRLSDELSDARYQLGVVEAEAKAAKVEAERTVDDLKTALAHTEASTSALAHDKAQLATTSDVDRSDLAAARVQLNQLEQANLGLARDEAELQQTIRTLKAQQTSVSSAVDGHAAQLVAATDQVAKLERELAQARGESESAAAVNNLLDADIETLRVRGEGLEGKLRERDDRIAEIVKARIIKEAEAANEIVELRDELVALTQVEHPRALAQLRTEHEQDVAKKEAEVAKTWRAKLATAQNEHQGELKAAKEKRERRHDDKLRRELDQVKGEKLNQATKFEQQSIELSEVKAELETIKTLGGKASADAKQDQDTIKELRAKLTDSQLELTDAQQYIHQLENGRPTSTTFSGGACPASVNEELAAVYKQLRAFETGLASFRALVDLPAADSTYLSGVAGQPHPTGPRKQSLMIPSRQGGGSGAGMSNAAKAVAKPSQLSRQAESVLTLDDSEEAHDIVATQGSPAPASKALLRKPAKASNTPKALDFNPPGKTTNASPNSLGRPYPRGKPPQTSSTGLFRPAASSSSAALAARPSAPATTSARSQQSAPPRQPAVGQAQLDAIKKGYKPTSLSGSAASGSGQAQRSGRQVQVPAAVASALPRLKTQAAGGGGGLSGGGGKVPLRERRDRPSQYDDPPGIGDDVHVRKKPKTGK